LPEIKRKIEDLAEPFLVSRGAFLVDVQVRIERGGKLVQLFVDTDKGITIEQCSEISRELLREFDAQRYLEGNYRLEVSSPGIDRPLKLLRQYSKNIGRSFRVKYSSQDGQKTASVKLLSVLDDVVTFQAENGEALTLPFPQIVESKEELPW
jgi:ribosome maturation factor RimP